MKDGRADELKDVFRAASNKLRILNNLRAVSVGIPLTSAQCVIAVVSTWLLFSPCRYC